MKSKYAGLWLLLAVALSIFLLISFSDDISIGKWQVKRAPFKDHLLGNDSVVADMQSAEEIMALDELVADVQTVDSMPQSIFIFGDSMTFNLALRLAQYATQNGHTINSVNWDSSNTITWSTTDTLKYYIDKFHPTFIFVALGANELYLRNPQKRAPNVRRILEIIDTIPYIWIGPPNWKEDMGINAMLAKECRKGSFFLTDGMQLARKKDHVHPTRAASAEWVDSIVRWMPRSAHPIVMDLPSDSIGKANPHITFLKALNK